MWGADIDYAALYAPAHLLMFYEKTGDKLFRAILEKKVP